MTWNQRRRPSGSIVGTAGANMRTGLDPELIQAFPTFSYSTVKEFRRQKYGLECAICLGEFSDEDMLRLLTICCHVFHKDCVDLWLDTHKTCPVCRRELDVPRKSLDKSLVHSNSMIELGPNHQSSQLPDSVCIDIKEDDEEEVDGGGGQAEGQGCSNTKEQHRKREKMERFSRSHSTGHSIARNREEEDKYTLKLPYHVKIKLLKGNNSAQSCFAFGDFSSPSDHRRNGGFGETTETRVGDNIDKV
ncbi:Zinc finger, RING-type [Corchorus capsularis]|uniref:RING-type E3 ubiquitin transferase n=1 Tax=Corchorus capsularis TaxID=210143 RepID=A0A1R3I3Y7_COCAP|nr:Zinc finger, RING-type [Corchorus capsularis]